MPPQFCEDEDHLSGLLFPFSSSCSSFAQNVFKVLTGQSNMQQLVIGQDPHFLGLVDIVAFPQGLLSPHRKYRCLGLGHQGISAGSESVFPCISAWKLNVLGNNFPKLAWSFILEIS